MTNGGLPAGLSKAQLDKLGERLRAGPATEADLTLLDDYRRSLRESYANVVAVVREKLQLETTGRPAKSTQSIVDKLKRESVRLTQIQDIAGCRIVVPDLASQDKVAVALRSIFPMSVAVDRRQRPSHNYRAVHVIVRDATGPVEVQVRTVLQHQWAECSEKLSDIVDPTIKYGGGPAMLRDILTATSKAAYRTETLEVEVRLAGLGSHGPSDEVDALLAEVAGQRVTLSKAFTDLLTTLSK